METRNVWVGEEKDLPPRATYTPWAGKAIETSGRVTGSCQNEDSRAGSEDKAIGES